MSGSSPASVEPGSGTQQPSDRVFGEMARQRWENEGGARTGLPTFSKDSYTARAPKVSSAMQHWHLPSIGSSTDKKHAREAGADAPRVETIGRSKPQVLFSHPECRAVLIDLASDERMADHVVRERAVIEVVSGRVSFDVGGVLTDCVQGSLVCLEPGERHAVHAHEDARLLLLLAPWRESPHAHDPERLPRNATATETSP